MPAPIAEVTPVGHYFDDAFVQQVREAVLAPFGLSAKNGDEFQCRKGAELPYEQVDLARVSTDNWFIRRFLKWEPTTVEQAVKTMHLVLTWRKRIGINYWDASTFPAEFYQVAACFSYLPDREGHNVIICRLRFNKKDPNGQTAVEELARKYFIHVLETVVSKNPNNGFGIVFDCTKAGISNIDLDMARFIINTLSSYYGGAISYVCIYELPWIFNQVWKLVRSWLEEDAKKIVKLATNKDIGELIDLAHLPDYMGGSALMNYRHVPKGAPNLDEVAQTLGITSRKDIARLYEHFQNLISRS